MAAKREKGQKSFGHAVNGRGMLAFNREVSAVQETTIDT
jgi:hypothetical protein